MQILADTLHEQGKLLQAQGARQEALAKKTDTHIKQCDESNAAKLEAFNDLAAAVRKVTDPFEKVDIHEVVAQFTVIDRTIRWASRVFAAAIALILGAIVTAGATLYFQNQFSHVETMRTVAVKAADRYTAAQAAADKAAIDARLKALESQ